MVSNDAVIGEAHNIRRQLDEMLNVNRIIVEPDVDYILTGGDVDVEVSFSITISVKHKDTWHHYSGYIGGPWPHYGSNLRWLARDAARKLGESMFYVDDTNNRIR